MSVAFRKGATEIEKKKKARQLTIKHFEISIQALNIMTRIVCVFVSLLSFLTGWKNLHTESSCISWNTLSTPTFTAIRVLYTTHA